MMIRYKGTSQQNYALDASLKLERACSSLERFLDRANAYGSLTPSQFRVLDVLYYLGSLSQSVIGQKLFKSAGNMTMVIDHLEKKQFVRRRQSEQDRRVTKVELTDMGRRTYMETMQGYVDCIVQATSSLSPVELETLAVLCKKLGLSMMQKGLPS